MLRGPWRLSSLATWERCVPSNCEDWVTWFSIQQRFQRPTSGGPVPPKFSRFPGTESCDPTKNGYPRQFPEGWWIFGYRVRPTCGPHPEIDSCARM